MALRWCFLSDFWLEKLPSFSHHGFAVSRTKLFGHFDAFVLRNFTIWLRTCSMRLNPWQSIFVSRIENPSVENFIHSSVWSSRSVWSARRQIGHLVADCHAEFLCLHVSMRQIMVDMCQCLQRECEWSCLLFEALEQVGQHLAPGHRSFRISSVVGFHMISDKVVKDALDLRKESSLQLPTSALIKRACTTFKDSACTFAAFEHHLALHQGFDWHVWLWDWPWGESCSDLSLKDFIFSSTAHINEPKLILLPSQPFLWWKQSMSIHCKCDACHGINERLWFTAIPWKTKSASSGQIQHSSPESIPGAEALWEQLRHVMSKPASNDSLSSAKQMLCHTSWQLFWAAVFVHTIVSSSCWVQQK